MYGSNYLIATVVEVGRACKRSVKTLSAGHRCCPEYLAGRTALYPYRANLRWESVLHSIHRGHPRSNFSIERPLERERASNLNAPCIALAYVEGKPTPIEASTWYYMLAGTGRSPGLSTRVDGLLVFSRGFAGRLIPVTRAT